MASQCPNVTQRSRCHIGLPHLCNADGDCEEDTFCCSDGCRRRCFDAQSNSSGAGRSNFIRSEDQNTKINYSYTITARRYYPPLFPLYQYVLDIINPRSRLSSIFYRLSFAKPSMQNFSHAPVVFRAMIMSFNPFTPKSDQCQISPAASPEM